MPQPPRHYALVPDRLWDGLADSPLAGLAVVVRNELIESITPVDQLPSTLPRVELPGCTLLPGLIDAHVHYSAALGSGFLAAGVTTIRDVGNNLEWILARRALHAADPMLGPTIVCCGHLHDDATPHWPRMGIGSADTAALRKSIQHHVARGVDQIKLYARLSIEMMLAGIDEAHLQKKFVLAHLGAMQAEDAARAGLNEFEHLAGCGVAWREATEAEDNAVIDIFLEHKVVINPTFVVWDRIGRIMERSFFHDERRRWVHPCHLDIWNRALSQYKDPGSRLPYQQAIPHLKRFMRRAHARGVVTALGTDTPFPHLVPGFSVHDELAMYVDAGLKPVDALRSATSVNAEVIGLSGSVGRIAPGFSANLLAVRGNPLENIGDISNVASVVRMGTVLDAQKLAADFKRAGETNPDDPVTLDLADYADGKRNSAAKN